MRRDATQRRGRILRPGARPGGVVTSPVGRGLHLGNVVHWAVCRLAAEQKVRPLRIVENPAPKKKIREVRGNLELDETYGLLEGTNPGMAMPVVATRRLWCKRAKPAEAAGGTPGAAGGLSVLSDTRGSAAMCTGAALRRVTTGPGGGACDQ